jgi:hypothetical protein
MSAIEVIRYIFKVIKLLVLAWEYVEGKYTQLQFSAQVKAIKEAQELVESGNPDNVLEGVEQYEDVTSGWTNRSK